MKNDAFRTPAPVPAGRAPAGRAGKRAALARLGRYFLRYKGMTALALFFSLAGNVPSLLGPVFSARAINAVEGTVDMPAVLFYCALMAGCYLLSAAFTYALTVCMTRLSRAITRAMREETFSRLLSLPVSFFDTRLAGDVLNRLTYDIDTVNASLSNDVIQLASGVITVVGSLVSMLLLSPLLRTIAAYGREGEICARYGARNEEAAQAYYTADYYGSKMGPAVNFVNNLSTVFISVFGGLLFFGGRIRLGDVSAFLQYSRKFTGPVNEFANIVSEIQSSLAAAERVFGILDEQPERHLRLRPRKARPARRQLYRPRGRHRRHRRAYGRGQDHHRQPAHALLRRAGRAHHAERAGYPRL